MMSIPARIVADFECAREWVYARKPYASAEERMSVARLNCWVEDGLHALMERFANKPDALQLIQIASDLPRALASTCEPAPGCWTRGGSVTCKFTGLVIPARDAVLFCNCTVGQPAMGFLRAVASFANPVNFLSACRCDAVSAAAARQIWFDCAADVLLLTTTHGRV